MYPGANRLYRGVPAAGRLYPDYLPSWSEELFTISWVKKTTPLTYVLKDDHGEEMNGTFYQEVQKVGDKEVYRIETVLKHRQGVGGQQ